MEGCRFVLGFFFLPLFCSLFLSLHSCFALSLCSRSYLCVHLPVGVMMRPDIPRVQECLNEAMNCDRAAGQWETELVPVLAETALKFKRLRHPAKQTWRF